VTPSGAKPNAAPPAAKPAGNAQAKGAEPQAGKADAPSCSINSFTAGTLVLMADGSKKPIKDVKVGDLVPATDPATGLTAHRPVIKLYRHTGERTMVKLELADGTTLRATDRHPFWDAAKRKFVDAIDLKVNQKVLAAGVAMSIASSSVYGADLTAYNLELDDLHTYYVGETPVLVHNCGSGGSAPSVPTVEFSRGRAPGLAQNFDDAVANGAPTQLNRVTGLHATPTGGPRCEASPRHQLGSPWTSTRSRARRKADAAPRSGQFHEGSSPTRVVS